MGLGPNVESVYIKTNQYSNNKDNISYSRRLAMLFNFFVKFLPPDDLCCL